MPLTPITAEWVNRFGNDVLLVRGLSVATVTRTSRGSWRAWRVGTGRSTYHDTREAAMAAAIPARVQLVAAQPAQVA